MMTRNNSCVLLHSPDRQQEVCSQGVSRRGSSQAKGTKGRTQQYRCRGCCSRLRPCQVRRAANPAVPSRRWLLARPLEHQQGCVLQAVLLWTYMHKAIANSSMVTIMPSRSSMYGRAAQEERWLRYFVPVRSPLLTFTRNLCNCLPLSA